MSAALIGDFDESHVVSQCRQRIHHNSHMTDTPMESIKTNWKDTCNKYAPFLPINKVANKIYV